LDISRVDSKQRDPERVGRLLASLGRNVATYVSIAALASDTGGADDELALTTVRDYLDALERLMIVENQPSWAPHLRSKSRLRKAAKRHLVDPSLAVAAVGAAPEDLLRDLEFFGFVFESLIVRDLRIYAQAAGAEVLQYRDSTGLEIDAIVRAPGDRWAAFEIKLGQARVDDGARNLLRFRERLDTRKCGEPQTIAVIVGTGYSYVRDDGVAVIAAGALGP
jgi:hypothetical protein